MIHFLKIEKQYLDKILDGSKTFEIRNNDSNFQVGDEVDFMEVLEIKKKIYVKNLRVRITYITNFPEGIKDGFVVFSFKII